MEFDDIDEKSWTDDLPSCLNSGIGWATNQNYREDGSRHDESYPFRDRNFHHKVDENTSVYAIFSGHHGSKVAGFAIQRMAAEILLGKLSGKMSEDEVKEVLKQAFITVENGYLNSIDGLLARKASLQYDIPDRLTQLEVSQKYKKNLDDLNAIHQDLAIGTSIVLVLIHYSKMYICNIGCCRALLCKNDANNVLRCVQLSVDHNLNNEDEILRLSQLGLDIQTIRSSPLESTRCIGNYLGKAGFKESDYLYAATNEPIISEPEITVVPIDSTCRFLLLLSNGMCKTLDDIFETETTQVNKELVQMTVEQFKSQSTLIGVAQSVVHKIVQLHHDIFMQQIQEGNNSHLYKQRSDVTFLVRNFNFKMPNAIQKRNNQPQLVRFNPVVQEHSNNLIHYTESVGTNDSSYSDDSEASGIIDKKKTPSKITPYVDFSEYFRLVAEAKINNCLPKNIEFDN